jgi:hypothetical protein
VQTLIKSWLNKQTVLADHTLCLSNRYLAWVLQKSQVTYRSILNFNNCQRGAHRAVVEERKKLPALGLLLTLGRLVQSRKVYSWAPVYNSIPPRQNQYESGVLAARGLMAEVATCDEVIYPGELPVGLSTLLHSPHSLLASHWRPGVGPPCTCSPSSPTWAPSKRSSVQWKRTAILVNWPWVSARSSREAPIHFWPQFMARFRVFPHALAGPRAAAVEDEGVGLPGELVSIQDADVLLPDPRRTARGAISPPTSSLTCQVPRTSSCCAPRQSEWSHCRPSRAACWPATCSLQLLTVYWEKKIFL